MGLRISTNVGSIAMDRNLRINRQAEQSSLEKLASGSRIVRAADDAAGLSISSKMNADIRSIRQATRNSNDGISIVQVAEGAMTEISSMLIRIRELSIQAASDTIGDTERQMQDREVQQLREEVGRISASTEFNGKKLLNVAAGFYEIQAGINNNPDEDRLYIDTLVANSTPEKLGITGVSVATKESARGNLETVDQALTKVSKSRAALGALQNRLLSSIQNGQIYDENLSGAKSRIKDVDMAYETAELTRTNIQTQSNVSLLGQAKSDGLLALKLLT